MNVQDANILVHSKMAKTYDQREPHFRPENQRKVRGVLEELRSRSGGRLLDVGCGTGFIINLARDLFDEIHGVDITEAMLEKVDASGGHIELHRCGAEQMPFDDACFDVVTAYAFLHHLQETGPVLREVFRVLKKGGVFYADLEPNRLFWQLATQHDGREAAQVRPLAKREIDSVCHTDDRVLDEFGIEKEVFNAAEYIKSISGGIDADILRKSVLEIGFSECRVDYQWFAGQGHVLHEQSEKDAQTVDAYLRDISPLSNALFKYLRFIITK